MDLTNFTLSKVDLNAFIKSLSKNFDVYAPVKDHVVDGGSVRFKVVSDAKVICLSENAYYPLKELFFRKKEVLFKYSEKGLEVPVKKVKSKAILGIRRCDLHSLANQDRIYMREVPDPYYIAEREKTLLIGYHCKKAEEYCFCGSIDLQGNADIMLYELPGNKFLVEVHSDNALRLVESLKKIFKKTDIVIDAESRKIEGSNRLQKKDVHSFYDNPGWQEGIDKCLSCAACNFHCPSCYCFNIHDEANVHNMKEGERIRTWAGCQLKSFTRVAGEHIFRDTRKDRFRHRIYHQLQYFKERYGTTLSSGCGRCIRFCPTKIDFIDILNRM